MNAKLLVGSVASSLRSRRSAGDRQPVDNDPGPPYQFTIVDLVYRVESIGGVVQDIEVKETPTEVRVDMAADVLFDFDKADLLPKAGRDAAEGRRFHPRTRQRRRRSHRRAHRRERATTRTTRSCRNGARRR